MDEKKEVHNDMGEQKTCSSCGTVYQGHFCPVCGAKAQEEITFCPVCGADRKGDAAFCLNCGFSFEGKKAEENAPAPAPRVVPVPEKKAVPAPVKAAPKAAKKTLDKKTLTIAGIVVAAILVVVLAIILLPKLLGDPMGGFGGGPQDSENGVEGLFYELNEDGQSYSVHGGGVPLTGELRIPSNYKGLPVTAIQESGFANSEITSLVLSGQMRKIGNDACAGCEKLTSVTFGATWEIGDRAFLSCVNLENMTLPEELQSIGGEAFSNCQKITSVTLPQNDNCMFGAGVFDGCIRLASVDLGGVTEIAPATFFGCVSLTNIMWNDRVRVICDSAFYNCAGLTSVVLPLCMEIVEDNAFAGCTSMASFTVGAQVWEFGTGVLAKCSKLTSIQVQNGNNTYKAEGNCIIEKDAGMIVSGCKTSVIPADSNIGEIGDYAFAYCEFESFEIPNNIIMIGEGSFDGCSKMTTLSVGENATIFKKYAFRGCGALAEVHLVTYEWSTTQDESNLTYDSGSAVMGMEDPARAAEVFVELNGFYFVASDGSNTQASTRANYVITVVDQNGDAVVGAEVSICAVSTGVCHMPVPTDAEGVSTHKNKKIDAYAAQVVIPDGYSHAEQTADATDRPIVKIAFEGDATTLTIVLTKN